MDNAKENKPNPRGGSRTGNPTTLKRGANGKTNRGKYSEGIDTPTALEIAFVDNYILTWNATKAAIKAGYSEKTAYSTGSKLTKMPRVIKLIDAKMALVKEDYRQTHEAITAFLMRIVYSDTTDLLHVTKSADGKTNGVIFKENTAMESGAGMLIDSITIGRHGVKIEIFSKQQALEMLNKHVGYYEKDNNQKVNVGPTIYLPDNGRDDVPNT